MTKHSVPVAAAIDAAVLAWLREFAAAVRSRDYGRGATLFDRDIVGFGTVAARADGLDALVREQWGHVWGVTEGFEFDCDDLRAERRGDRAWVAAQWSSTGFAADGAPFPRRGRCTIVLARAPDGGWRAVHTHFSLDPPGAAAVIHYVVTADHAYTIREFLEAWAPELRERLRIVTWENVRWTGAAAGAWTLSDLERLTDAERLAAIALRRRLARAGPSVRVLNDPERTLVRYPLLVALAERGVNTFRAFRLDAASGAIRHPSFLRAERSHDGPLTPLVSSDAEMTAAAQALLSKRPDLTRRDLLAVEWCDTRSPDGLWRKWSALRVGDTLVPRHVLAARDWVVKKPDVVNEAVVHEEADYIEHFPHRAQVAAVFELAGVEYGRIDYAMAGGRIQVFEINTNPVVVPAPARLAPERLPSQSRSAALLRDAFRAIDAGLPGPGRRSLVERSGVWLQSRLERRGRRRVRRR